MTPNIFRTGYGINMLFGAKRVKMIKLQLYGSDFVNSVRKKNGGNRLSLNLPRPSENTLSTSVGPRLVITLRTCIKHLPVGLLSTCSV